MDLPQILIFQESRIFSHPKSDYKKLKVPLIKIPFCLPILSRHAIKLSQSPPMHSSEVCPQINHTLE